MRAPVYCRPAGIGLRFLQGKQQPLDISLGGMRIFSDEPVKKGTKLELELFLPDNTRIDELPAGSPARHDVGLKFVDIKDGDKDRLAAVLDEA